MNRKGFTLIELIATIVILGIVAGITITSIVGLVNKTKERSEDAFVETIKDALDMYLDSSEAKGLITADDEHKCSYQISKTKGNVNVYVDNGTTKFLNVIDSEYKPITQKDLVNPANKDVACNSDITIRIYRDEDHVYYYSVDKSAFGCLTGSGVISNLPEGFKCRD